MASLGELFPYESKFLDVPAGKLAYVDEGEGTPILCTHGNPTWSFYYREVVKRFGDRHRVVAPDHIGCGRSSKPQDWSYRLADHVANLERLVLELDLRDIVMVCHDWGGPTGFGVAGRHPDRFRGFVVLNTAAFFVDRIPFRIAVCKWPVLGDLMVRGLNGFARAATVMTTERPLAPDVKAALLAPYDSWANRIATHRFVQDIPMRPDHPSWGTLQDVEAGLESLKAKPMMIAWGMKDFCFSPRFLDEWKRRFPDAQVTPFEDVGHYVMEDAPARVLDLMEHFLPRALSAEATG